MRLRKSEVCVSIKWLKWISHVGFAGRLDLEHSATLCVMRRSVEDAKEKQLLGYFSVEEMEAAFP